ncbi:MAG: alanine--tRNA ligase [Candidatus Omnitrophica bacterium]|nr:alanine--tRNA ligase [Candidatus Omnitrophota bacterium]MBU1923692.1 alanine--tRNA ligase [Candidatus Omnitrophota bacterium]
MSTSMTADSLRAKFLDFFKAKKHKIIESDSLVPKDDPTVLFTPAGMNQFKKEFMGFDSGFKRAATSQRCLRTDDLDKVGKTSSHHTFFEMLGNFSFGDYFKQEAIAWAWEFLTKELNMDQEKLWVSVYQEDDEAYNIWKDKIGIPEKKIIKLGDKDNFWPAEAKEKGPNGPCGPCSEIFFDFGPGVGCGEKVCDPSCSCGRFVEIWNLVFTQFNRKDDASLEPLPNKNIDTGMGLERLTAVMQGKQNNFETELFQPIINEITYNVKRSEAGIVNFSMQIGDLPLRPRLKELEHAVADHIRAVVFCIYDGVLPSNESRGYVVRKIIRKSVMYLRELGVRGISLYKLVHPVVETMKNIYPDLKNQEISISGMIYAEEDNFLKTLATSDGLLNDKFSGFINKPDPEGAGKTVFYLYDTCGIPLELILDWLKEHKIDYSIDVFNRELGQQKARSKSQSSMKGDVFDAKGLGLKIAETKFVGYKESSCQANILAILKDGKEASEILAGDSLQIVLDQTPFYAESGGQVGDTGKLINRKNVFEVLNTQKIDNVILHIGKINSGSFKKGEKVVAEINVERRLKIARNHTATHILQAALRQVLGNHVQQQGSLVAEDRFRFDFTHFKGLSEEEILRVEQVANKCIAEKQNVSCKEMAFKEAKKAGALAFFEEKYGENVRVVAIGEISKELCGGTHLDNISKIGLIKIVSEGSVASGIRRIEGVTASFAEQFIKDEEQKAAEESMKKDRLKELKQQEKKRSAEINNSLQDVVPGLIDKAVTIGNINLVSSLEDGLDMQALRLLADKIKEQLRRGVIVLGSQDNEQRKAYLVIAVTQDLLSKGLDAGVLIRQVASLIGGSGGGRQDFAQAGGTKPENFTLAFDKIKDIIKNYL